MSEKEKMEITTADVGVLALGEPKHKDGDCVDCGGPCKGHMRTWCDAKNPTVTCTHAPGSRQCDHMTLHDDDETSDQARAAKISKTRKYSRGA